MRNVGLIAVIVVLAVFGTAVAQENAAWLGRGGTGVATTNEDATGFVNPATLAQIDMAAQASDPEDKWIGQWGYSQDLNAEDNYWVFQAAARRAGGDYGIGGGYVEDTSSNQMWYASYGKQYNDKWAWGLTLADMEIGTGVAEVGKVILNAGLAYKCDKGLLGLGDGWSFGLVGRDVLDNIQGTFDAGIALDFGRLQITADAIDVTDEIDSYFNVGGEYQVCKYLVARAGALDGDFTWGGTLKYNRLALDYGIVDLDANSRMVKAASEYVPTDFDALTLRYVYSW